MRWQMSMRREFTPAQKRQIVERSKNERGEICCEGCGLVLGHKPYEVDHILPEGLITDADKTKPLVIAEGQVLGKDCCHRGLDGKTAKDVKRIAKAKAQFDVGHGLSHRKKQPIRSAGFPKAQKPVKAVPDLPRRSLFVPVSATEPARLWPVPQQFEEEL